MALKILDSDENTCGGHVMHVNIKMNVKNTMERAKETVKNVFIGQVVAKLKKFLNFLLTFISYYDIIKM